MPLTVTVYVVACVWLLVVNVATVLPALMTIGPLTVSPGIAKLPDVAVAGLIAWSKVTLTDVAEPAPALVTRSNGAKPVKPALLWAGSTPVPLVLVTEPATVTV